MLSKILKLLRLLLLVPMLAFGQPSEDSDSFIAVDKLHFSLALGLGHKSNPLNGGDDIPLYIVPSLKYYGEQVFFDNGDLGYSFYDNNNFIISLLGRVNEENAYFSRWHPKNIFVLDGSNSIGDSNSSTILPEKETEDLSPERIDLDQVTKRDWALDAGVQLNWFIDERTTLLVQLMHDVNKVYHGFNGKVELFKQFKLAAFDNLSIQTTLGFTWASQQLVEYYYGLNENDTIDKNLHYAGKSSINPYGKLYIGYKLDHNWKAFVSLQYKALGSGITNSPLVKDDYAVTAFAGVSYAF